MKFLVVDDSQTMRRIVNNALKNIGYEEIIEAEDGKDAIGKLYVEKVDFIITDWNMPNMSGLSSPKLYAATSNLLISRFLWLPRAA